MRGDARVDGEVRPWSFFVKVVQSWSRSPLFEMVPEDIRDVAAASVPWRTEPLVYRSDLAARLPDGLLMPAAHGVFDLDDASASIWLEEVAAPPAPVTWDLDRFRHAAGLLGRVAANPRSPSSPTSATTGGRSPTTSTVASPTRWCRCSGIPTCGTTR